MASSMLLFAALAGLVGVCLGTPMAGLVDTIDLKQIALALIALTLFRFFIGRKWRMGVALVLIAWPVGAGLHLLKQPKVAEAAVRGLVKVGGLPETVFDHFQVLDDSAWYDVITKGNLGLAEAYMHGKAKVEPYALLMKLLNGTSVGTRRTQGTDPLSVFGNFVAGPLALMASMFNQQTLALSKRVTEMHYDAGNDLYEVMLGPSMSYTCAYWLKASNLNEAQAAKFDLVFRKLQLPGTPVKIADIGMGWGTLAAHVHEQAGGLAEVNGVSLSKEQVKWASQHLTKPGLKFIWTDYREHCKDPEHMGTYDRVYSIGMLEHVGYKNQASFFKCVKALLKPDGLAVVHTIGEPDFIRIMDPFLDKYIFPGAVIPSLGQLTANFERDFILEDFQNFGHDYAPTLAAWEQNAEVFFRDHPDAYSQEFQRMWRYYLQMCQVLFELRINQLWQFVLSPRPTYRKRIQRQT